MNATLIKSISTISFLFFIGITPLSAQTNYYIDPVNGNDDNVGGTLASPWKSFKNIMTYYNSSFKPAQWEELNPGDTIFLMDGVHNTVLNPGGGGGSTDGGSYIGYFRTKHGDANNWFYIKAYPGANPILDPAGTGMGLKVFQSSYWDISGITIRNAYTSGEGGGIAIAEISNVKIHDVEVYDTDGLRFHNMAGLHIAGGYEIEIYNSSFYDNYDRTTEPVGDANGNGSNIKIFKGGNISIYDNEIYNSAPITADKSAMGIVYKHASPDPNAYLNVYNNIFKNLKQTAFQSGTANTHFHHNIIIDSDGISSRDWGGPTHQVNQIFEYNTIYSSIYSANWRTSGFLLNPTINWRDTDFPDDPKNIIIRNNIIYDIRNSYGGENGVIDIGTYMSDELYNEIYPELTIEDNCYYNPSISVQLNIGAANGGSYGVLGDAYSLSDWQTDLGFDVNAVEADPMFVNIAGENFQLISGSPCENMGAYADSGLSVNDETINDTISIYPNPTNNTFTIDLKNETLKKVVIYNELGQQVKTVTTNEPAYRTGRVNISNLSNGIYFVKITSQSGKTVTKKIIKK